jgi:hypothetical protein
MTSKYLKLCVLFFSVLFFGCDNQIHEREDAITEKESIQSIIGNNGRLANIASSLLSSRDSIFLLKEEKAYIRSIYDVISSKPEIDRNKYNKAMLLRGINIAFRSTDNGYIYNERWHVDVNEGSPYSNSPPLMINLAYHGEIILYPECNSDNKPVIMYVEAYKHPNHSKVGAALSGGAVGWTVNIHGANIRDVNSLTGRGILFDVGCDVSGPK